MTLGSQSTSSDHSQCRLPSSPSSAARMLTTRSRSVNSKRCGHVRVAELRAHLRVRVHHREDLVDDLDELVLGVELDLGHQAVPPGVEPVAAAGLRARGRLGLRAGGLGRGAARRSASRALGRRGLRRRGLRRRGLGRGLRRAAAWRARAARARASPPPPARRPPAWPSASRARRPGVDSASISARSPRTSSRTRRSSKLSRIRCAAEATSSSRLRPRSRAPSVPPVVAWKVRSTAPRTASTTSAGSRPLSFFAAFLSFLGMVAAVYVSVSAPATIHLRPHEEVAERVLLPGDPGPRAAARAAAAREAEDAQPQPRAVGLLRHGGRRRAADDPEHRHGRPERRDRARGADRAGRAADRARRHLRRAGGRPRARDAAGRRRRARRGRHEPGARRERDAARPTRRCSRRCGAAAGDAATGLVVSSDLFYDPDPERARAWARAGALAVEMEAATLLAVAGRRDVAAAIVLAVSDTVADGARIGQEALERAEAELGRAGLAALCLGGSGLLGARLARLGRRAPCRPRGAPARAAPARAGVDRAGQQRHVGGELRELALDRGQPLVDARRAGCRRRP